MKRSYRGNRLRLGLAKALFLALFVVVGGRAFQLQVLQGDKLKRLGERQHLKEWIVLPKRGSVMDRAGEPLASAVNVTGSPLKTVRLTGLSVIFGAGSAKRWA